MLYLQLRTKSFHFEPSCLIYIRREQCRSRKIIKDMIIGYLRVSTGKQNPANQQDEIRRFADSRNLSINQWVTEVASGKKKGLSLIHI